MVTAIHNAAALTITEAAALLGCPVDTLRGWARAHQIASTRVGRKYRFSEKDIEEFLHQGRQELTRNIVDVKT